MGVSRRGDFWPGLMNVAVNRKRCTVQQPLTFNDVALMANPDQIRDPHQLERATHGIDPEGVSIDGVTDRDVTRNALVKTKLAEDSQCRGKALLTL